MENRIAKQILSRGWYQWEWGYIRKGCRRVKMAVILCAHVWKMEKWVLLELFQQWGTKENDGGVSSTMIDCENFCKCHNVLPVQ
jgi:hypothetical protein